MKQTHRLSLQKKVECNTHAHIVAGESHQETKVHTNTHTHIVAGEIASRNMRRPGWIFDTRGIVNIEEVKRHGLKLWVLGNGEI